MSEEQKPGIKNANGISQCRIVSAMPFLAVMLCALPLAAANEAVFSDGTLTFNVNAADYPETSPYVYGGPIPSDATAIVKRGSGSVTLGDYNNNLFIGTVTVEANGGFLMGNVKAFGKASEVVVNNGGAVMFTETVKDGVMRDTRFKIAGAGPDGTGALMRPNANPGPAHDFFQYITLTDDATINAGSRWGLAGGKLDMGNHTLTIRNDRHVASNWEKNFCCFDLSYDNKVKDPGAIVIESGLLSFQKMGESKPRLLDDVGSNGTVSNMTITLKGNEDSRIRLMGVAKDSVPCKIVTEGTPSLMTQTESPLDDLTMFSNWDGPVHIGSESLKLMRYSGNEPNAGFVFNKEVSGVGVLNHDIPGHLIFTGSTTNTLAGLTQSSSGATYLRDSVRLNVTNSLVAIAGGTVASPSTLELRDNSSIEEYPAPADRMQRTVWRIGEGPTVLPSRQCGLLKVYDGAVVSNSMTLGYRGYGACYQFGGKIRLLDGRDSNDNVFIGRSGWGYGYLAIDGGEFSYDHWAWLGGDGHGFIVQRGGEAHHGLLQGNKPLRIAFKGAGSYGYCAVLGGRSVWRNYPAFNFASFDPNSESSTGVFTVHGENADVDMTESFIRIVACTNSTKPVTALVNVSAGGRLKTKYIAVEQVPSLQAPAWNSVKTLVPQGTKTYLNFNGGVLVAAQSGDFFNAANGDVYRLPTRATVYEKGLVFDTDGKDVVWRKPLQRPYGYGIKSITLPEEAMLPKVLLGPSRCVIASAQSGAGADALMDFDNMERVARGMIVTSPGFGYEEGPTVTVLKQVQNDAPWVCSVETVNYDDPAFKHGGLAKRGEGVLTLEAENTYGGATRIEGGTLVFTHPNGLPEGGAIEFPAAAVTAASSDNPMLRANTFRSGEVRVLAGDTLNIASFGRFKTIATFDNPVSSVPALRLVDSEGAAMETGSWRLRISADGKALRFGAERGLAVVIR